MLKEKVESKPGRVTEVERSRGERASRKIIVKQTLESSGIRRKGSEAVSTGFLHGKFCTEEQLLTWEAQLGRG